MKTAAIINPQSGGGRTIKVWRELGEALSRKLGGLQIFFTEKAHHAIELARQVAIDDFDRLIVVGGDGTLHECVNGLFDKSKPLFKEKFEVAVLNGGRGCDYAKTLKLPTDPQQMLQVAITGHPRAVDVGEVCFDGERTVYYINSSTAGLGGEVARDMQGGSHFLPASASYLAAALRGLLQAKPKRIELSIDGKIVYHGLTQNVFVCNGRYSGGGMLWAPNGHIDDGQFDILLVRDLNRMQLFGLTPHVYAGTLSTVKGVSEYTGSKVRVAADEPIIIELDGETYNATTAQYSIHTRALKILVP